MVLEIISNNLAYWGVNICIKIIIKDENKINLK